MTTVELSLWKLVCVINMFLCILITHIRGRKSEFFELRLPCCKVIEVLLYYMDST